MNKKTLKFFTALCIGAITAVAAIKSDFSLALTGVLTGLFFFTLVLFKSKKRSDEREILIQEKSARIAYAILVPTIGLTAFLLLLPSQSDLSVFSKGDWLYLESLGMIFSYLTFFLFSVYAVLYHFFSNRFGSNNEK